MKSPSSAHSLVSIVCIAAALSLSAGCGSSKPGWASLNPNDWSDQRVSDDPLVLELEGPISLDIESFAGDVTIEADPGLTHGEVVITREGKHGFGRSKESKVSLSDISASVEIVAADTSRGELGQTLRIRTETANPEPHLQRAHVHVKAPAIEGMTIHTDDGNVTAMHVEGMMDIETSNGNVTVRTNLALLQPVTIINRNGEIVFRMRGESAGVIDAQTIGGKVSADIRYGNMRVQGSVNSDQFMGVLNDGTNRMIFRTTRGDIKISVLAENEKTIFLPDHRKPEKEEPLVQPTEEPEGN